MTENNLSRAGYVAIVGPPNAGKSTLMNKLLGQKLAIVSPKVQTTRTRLAGILSEDDVQIIFLDTPGIFSPREVKGDNKGKQRLERAMVEAAYAGAEDADVILLMLDASDKKVLSRNEELIQPLLKTHKPLYVALNKVDSVHREALLPLAAEVQSLLNPIEIFMISAENGSGIERVRKVLADALPESPFLFDPEEVTDTPMRLLAAEFTREQLFLQLGKEVPYDATVETEKWEQFDNGSVKIMQSIIVNRDGQKAIVIGKGGSRLKEIGAAARAQIAELVGAPVHLMLHVKVRDNWQDKNDYYTEWGLKR